MNFVLKRGPGRAFFQVFIASFFPAATAAIRQCNNTNRPQNNLHIARVSTLHSHQKVLNPSKVGLWWDCHKTAQQLRDIMP